MDLITTELTKYKKLSEKLTKICSLNETELNLLNKLIVFEQKSNSHLNELVFKFDNYLNHFKNNNHLNGLNDLMDLEKQKTIAKQNDLKLNQLRQQLHDWRLTNGRLVNGADSLKDHIYSKGSDGRFKKKTKKSLPNENPLITINEIESVETQTRSSLPVNTGNLTISPIIVRPLIDETNVNSDNPQTSEESTPSIQIEIIPKTEPLSDEETNSAPETETENTAPTTSQPKPFQFLSEFLSKNTAFSHLINTLNEAIDKSDENLDDKTKIDKIVDDKNVVEIDLNNESNDELEDFGIQPIVIDNEDEIIDLTPKESVPKKSVSKNKIRRKLLKKSMKKKKLMKSKIKRKNVINTMNRSKNNIRNTNNNSNTITGNNSNTGISEVKESPNKTIESIGVEDNESRALKAVINANIVANNKKIVFRDQMYICKWKNCSYKTRTRSIAIRHSWRHTGEKPFKCENCSEGFRDKRLRARHYFVKHGMSAPKIIGPQLKHNDSKPQKQSQLKPNKRQFETKKQMHPRGSGDVLCPKCDHKYVEINGLFRHMKKIHGLKAALNARKKYYKQKSHSINGKNRKINRNSEIRLRQLKSNALTNNDNNIKNVSPNTSIQSIKSGNYLKFLNKMFKSVDQTVTEELFEWKCDFNYCQRSYISKSNLKRHQWEIHKKLSKPLFYSHQHRSDIYANVKYFIPKPSDDSKNNETISIKRKAQPLSKQIQSSDDKKFVCNYSNCSNRYYTISGLYKHKKNFHNSNKTLTKITKGNKKFNKTSYQSTGTTDQLNSEFVDNNKPSLNREWICEIPECGARYVWKSTLKKHMSDKHQRVDQTVEEKEDNQGLDAKIKYDCPYTDCHFQTSGRKRLVSHYKSHFAADDKPFKCLITGCSYSHKLLSRLKNHVLNRHSEQEFFRAMEASGINYPTWY